MTIDLEGITAIDVHVHVHRSARAVGSDDERLGEMAGYFRSGPVRGYSVPEIADYYRQRRMACVVFTVDSVKRATGPSNEEVAELAAGHADVVIPFASIDPARGGAGVRELRRLAENHGIRGVKFHPNTQEFFPNDRVAYPLYEVMEEHGLIALFHSGQTGVGAGTRGGGGVRLKYGNPMHVDDVAVDFPTMRIILAHPSFPWQDEALAVAMHKRDVYIDLSGWSPKYFPPNLVRYANTLLRNKVLFGSDFPVITPDRWLADLPAAGIRDEVRPDLLKGNAIRLLGLDGQS
ncbi:4-hydroxyphenyl-beta-ketoacyl-CoA hydrolase [Virgisporangium ochraceum]|uniref:4-hydroxyphenyl-beta-ketoacyl-CoA hydrolase n=1 Tax=Virgisporangium ochraceum TaxID=65505 RepID=A0A8J4A2F1_9ACTN|nr:amidohydrolase family protein [Virgisporangium ochraceum]GIJ74494.1 4-hydroxyphenyl-beta-ketoacyl-CoA hydrolase [Virgisporangium ochraceum]